MNSKKILFSQTLDINTSLDGGLPDVGVNYVVPEVYAPYLSVDAAGIVTPLALPPSEVAGVLVVVEDASTNEEVAKIALVIRQSAAGTLEIGFDML